MVWAVCLVTFCWFLHREAPFELQAQPIAFAICAFHVNPLCSSVLVHYFMVHWLFYLSVSSDIKNKILTAAFWSWMPPKWYQSSVRVFAMADEKTMISGVKVKLKPFDGRTNFTLWQRKMKNILIKQDLHMCTLGIEYKPEEITLEA